MFHRANWEATVPDPSKDGETWLKDAVKDLNQTLKGVGLPIRFACRNAKITWTRCDSPKHLPG
jgi:hypothetical protein